MPDNYPLFRASLAPAYAEADTGELDNIARRIYGPGANAEDVENFFSDIGNGLSSAASAVGHFAQQAAPVVARALPSMAQGAMAGSALGPWGALAGAVAGGAGSILSQTNNPTARAIGGGLSTVTNLASTIRGGGPTGAMGALGALGGGTMQGAAIPLSPAAGGGSANALIGLLGRPEITQGLLQGALGQFGRQNIAIGGQQIPTSLLLNALGTLANRAAHEAAEAQDTGEALPAHFVEAAEALGLESEDVEGRTDTLLTLLALSPALFSNNRPVVVNQTAAPPDPPPPPAGETTWIAESDEDYGEIEEWESAYA